jgi:hypothetical protein
LQDEPRPPRTCWRPPDRGPLDGIARRHARWGTLDEDQKAAGAAELREIERNRPDLLAEVAGLALGTAEGKGPEYLPQGQAVAELCRMAGADESLIPGWIEEGSAGRRPRGCLRSAARPRTAPTGSESIPVTVIRPA